MIRYSPAPVPNKPEDLPAYLREEFARMSAIIGNLADGLLHFLLHLPRN